MNASAVSSHSPTTVMDCRKSFRIGEILTFVYDQRLKAVSGLSDTSMIVSTIYWWSYVCLVHPFDESHAWDLVGKRKMYR